MIHKEDAERLWCPFSRAHEGTNRLPVLMPACSCMTVKCMAWQTGDDPREGYCKLIERLENVR